MPMGVVNDNEFESQLNNVKKEYKNEVNIPIPQLIEGEVIETPSKGRNENDVNVPSTMRALIADTHHNEGRKAAVELAKTFGVSASSASAYANGATSTDTYKQPKSDLLNVITKRRRRNAHKALSVLNHSLDELTPTRISSAKTRDIAAIAKDMASIVKIMEPESNNAHGPLVQFNLYAPPIREEASYDSIQVIE